MMTITNSSRSEEPKKKKPVYRPRMTRAARHFQLTQQIVIKIAKEKSDIMESVADTISRGIPTDSITYLFDFLDVKQGTGLSFLDISSATFSRRKKQGKLDADESNRVYRYAQIADMATEMFQGDAEEAKRWLKTPAQAFGGEMPLEHARTEFGAREVEMLIGRIRHGIPV